MEQLDLVLSEYKQSQLGNLLAAQTRRGVYAFAFGLSRTAFLSQIEKRTRTAVLSSVTWQEALHPILEQAAEYLAGQRRQFDLQIDYTGLTDFQVEVYRAVLAVPYGQTATYGQIAEAIGRPLAARAVGAANGANPLPILIPCHRLVGADGSLRGYGGTGGLKTKRWLIDLEAGSK